MAGLPCPGRRRLGLERPITDRIRGDLARLRRDRDSNRRWNRQVERLDAGERHGRPPRAAARPLEARGFSGSRGRAARERLPCRGTVTRRRALVGGLRGERSLPADRALALVVTACIRPARAAVGLRGCVQREDARHAGERHRRERRRDPRDGHRSYLPEHSRGHCRNPVAKVQSIIRALSPSQEGRAIETQAQCRGVLLKNASARSRRASSRRASPRSRRASAASRGAHRSPPPGPWRRPGARRSRSAR